MKEDFRKRISETISKSFQHTAKRTRSSATLQRIYYASKIQRWWKRRHPFTRSYISMFLNEITTKHKKQLDRKRDLSIVNEHGFVLLCPITCSSIQMNEGFLIDNGDHQKVAVNLEALCEYCASNALFKCPLTMRDFTETEVMQLQSRSRGMPWVASCCWCIYDSHYKNRTTRRNDIVMRMNLIAGLERQCDNAFARIIDSLLIDSERYQNTESRNRVLRPRTRLPVVIEGDEDEEDVRSEDEDDVEIMETEEQKNEDYEIAVCLWRIDDFNRFFEEYKSALNDLKRVDPLMAKNQYTRDHETLLRPNIQTRIIDLESREYKVLLIDFRARQRVDSILGSMMTMGRNNIINIAEIADI